MPYYSDQKKINPTDDLPQHLAHKPVYALPYEYFDGFNAGNTDARFISIGLAQYDLDEVSIKILRHTGEKWTRQSEEIPLHRLIDAVIFLASAIYDTEDGNLAFEEGTFENQTEDIEITRENRTSGEMSRYHRFLDKHKQLIDNRFKQLYDLLSYIKSNRDKNKF